MYYTKEAANHIRLHSLPFHITSEMWKVGADPQCYPRPHVTFGYCKTLLIGHGNIKVCVGNWGWGLGVGLVRWGCVVVD